MCKHLSFCARGWPAILWEGRNINNLAIEHKILSGQPLVLRSNALYRAVIITVLGIVLCVYRH